MWRWSGRLQCTQAQSNLKKATSPQREWRERRKCGTTMRKKWWRNKTAYCCLIMSAPFASFPSTFPRVTDSRETLTSQYRTKATDTHNKQDVVLYSSFYNIVIYYDFCCVFLSIVQWASACLPIGCLSRERVMFIFCVVFSTHHNISAMHCKWIQWIPMALMNSTIYCINRWIIR